MIKLIHYIKLIYKKCYGLLSTVVFKLKLKLYECPYGKKLQINGKVLIISKDKEIIVLGNNVKINSSSSSNLATNKTIFQILNGGKIVIGNYTGLTSTIMSSRNLISIGNNVRIGANCRIYDHDFHHRDYLQRRKNIQNDIKAEPVVIEDDVFIGTGSIILKGVRIGARTIISAGSVVSKKNIPPDSIVAGNPAQSIKFIQKQL